MGLWRSLGARFHGMEEVVGSIPTRSTNPSDKLRQFRSSAEDCYCCARGLQSCVWYIDAMKLKGLAIFAILLAIIRPPAPVFAQATNHSGANGQASPLSSATNNPTANWQSSPLSFPSITAPPGTGTATAGPECNGVPCEYQQPRITVANPAPAPAPVSWPLHEQIAWAANLVLVILGYVGIILAVSMLKKMERQTRTNEAIAEAALLNAQAVIDSGRPWILITVEPSRSVENSFTVKATNRGRCPANMISTEEQIRIAIDETRLPRNPEYKREEAEAPFVPVILLPGESTPIKQFSREDVRGICESEEMFKRVENWEEKIFIYGRVLYQDLIAPADNQTHVTTWCCWYIHGRQKSALVMAGPPEYNLHT